MAIDPKAVAFVDSIRKLDAQFAREPKVPLPDQLSLKDVVNYYKSVRRFRADPPETV
jgi:hypothetical protein